jgi:hypothetical protein
MTKHRLSSTDTFTGLSYNEMGWVLVEIRLQTEYRRREKLTAARNILREDWFTGFVGSGFSELRCNNVNWILLSRDKNWRWDLANTAGSIKGGWFLTSWTNNIRSVLWVQLLTLNHCSVQTQNSHVSSRAISCATWWWRSVATRN